jgi:hypothetical protein
MYRLDVTLYEDKTVLQSKQLYISDLETAKQLMDSVQLPVYTEEDGEAPSGRIVTPLPPQKIHSTEGIVTPKLPIEIARAEAERNKETPEEPLPGESTEG